MKSTRSCTGTMADRAAMLKNNGSLKSLDIKIGELQVELWEPSKPNATPYACLVFPACIASQHLGRSAEQGDAPVPRITLDQLYVLTLVNALASWACSIQENVKVGASPALCAEFPSLLVTLHGPSTDQTSLRAELTCTGAGIPQTTATLTYLEAILVADVLRAILPEHWGGETNTDPKEAYMLPRVAIIGAGLAGLSAAYYLRSKATVTIFEKEGRLGGRVLTSHAPEGEHGAEFFLSRTHEPAIHKLIEGLGLHVIPWTQWPGYVFRGQFACQKPSKASKKLLSPESATRVQRVLKLVKKEAWNNSGNSLNQWLADVLENDRDAKAFVNMLCIGETCAPNHHITAGYGLECLASLYDEWYSIRGGSVKLVDALVEKSGPHTAHTVRRAHVNQIQEDDAGVAVHWTEGRKKLTDTFWAVIIATPGGERLIGEPVQRHFHAYINILLEYDGPVQLKAAPAFQLERGLYMDGPLNYMQLTKKHNSSTVRVLMPNATSRLNWPKRQLVEFCEQRLQVLLIGPPKVRCSAIQRWEYGLPCGSGPPGRPYRRVAQNIYLAGDRFGQWPSMDAAIASGRAAGKAVASLVTRSYAASID